MENLKQRLNFIFYADDFKRGNDIKPYWVREFKNARKLDEPEDLKEWALTNLEYIDDFQTGYIKDEVEQLLNDIIRYAMIQTVLKLKENFGNDVKLKEDEVFLHDEDCGSKFVITYKNIIIGSELMNYSFMFNQISNMYSCIK